VFIDMCNSVFRINAKTRCFARLLISACFVSVRQTHTKENSKSYALKNPFHSVMFNIGVNIDVLINTRPVIKFRSNNILLSNESHRVFRYAYLKRSYEHFKMTYKQFTILIAWLINDAVYVFHCCTLFLFFSCLESREYGH